MCRHGGHGNAGDHGLQRWRRRRSHHGRRHVRCPAPPRRRSRRPPRPPPTPAPTTTDPVPTTDRHHRSTHHRRPPPTTAPPLDPIADLAAALQRDAQAAEDLSFAVLADPRPAMRRIDSRQVFDGDALENVIGDAGRLPAGRSRGRSRTPTYRSQLVIRAGPELHAGQRTAPCRAQTCRLDSVNRDGSAE